MTLSSGGSSALPVRFVCLWRVIFFLKAVTNVKTNGIAKFSKVSSIWSKCWNGSELVSSILQNFYFIFVYFDPEDGCTREKNFHRALWKKSEKKKNNPLPKKTPKNKQTKNANQTKNPKGSIVILLETQFYQGNL